MQQNSDQNYANVPYHQVQQASVNPPVVIQPVRVEPPVRVQQVVVTRAPLVQQSGQNISEPFIFKQRPWFFYLFLIQSILIGIGMFAAKSYVVAILVLAIGIPMTFTLKDLTIRAQDDQIFIGFGPLKCCVCCLQEITVPYTNIISYGEYSNQCWYPLGYHPAFFDRYGGDCCINLFFRGCFCCTNAFFYNAACIFCCFVVQAPQLIVLTLKVPVTCCCHTLSHVAISLPDSKPLKDFLHSKGLVHDSNTGVVTQTVVSVQQQHYAPLQQQVQVQQMQPQIQQSQAQVQLQPMQNQPLMQNEQLVQNEPLMENNEGGNTGQVYGEHLQQSQM